MDFVIHWNETAMGLYVFPIDIFKRSIVEAAEEEKLPAFIVQVFREEMILLGLAR